MVEQYFCQYSGNVIATCMMCQNNMGQYDYKASENKCNLNMIIDDDVET